MNVPHRYDTVKRPQCLGQCHVVSSVFRGQAAPPASAVLFDSFCAEASAAVGIVTGESNCLQLHMYLYVYPVVTMKPNTDVHVHVQCMCACGYTLVHTCGKYATRALAHVLGMVTCKHTCIVCVQPGGVHYDVTCYGNVKCTVVHGHATS